MKNFEKILKYFKTPSTRIESLNLNYFGSYKQQKFTIKSLKLLNFKRLNEFHFLSIDFELNDLLKLVKNTSSHIKSISFTITDKHLILSDKLENSNFESFKNLEHICLEFRTNPSDTFYAKLIDNCTNLNRLELYWSREQHRNKRVFFFERKHFVLNRFEYLKHLILGANIRFSLDRENLALLSRLEYFNVNVELNIYENEREILENYDFIVKKAKRISLVQVGGEDEKKLLVRVRTNYAFMQRLGVFRLAEDEDLCFRENFYEKLCKLEFISSRLHVILLDSLKVFHLSEARNLVELDLSQVHVHSTKGVGSDLASLKCKF